MMYYPTMDELLLLKHRFTQLYCKIELLDKEMVVIDSLEGLVMTGSISIDADSDLRRTFTSTIYLNEKNPVSAYTPEEWIDKYIRVYIGCKTPRQEIKWWSQGVYAFSQNGFNYSATEHTLSISCVDLVAKLDGSLGGQLTGHRTAISMGSNIRSSIIATLKLSGFTKYMVDYWNRTVPCDLEYDTGTTIWAVLKELRDLYYPFEMYFDDDTFICQEIPSGYGDPVVLDADVFSELVISENASVDYSEVKNCVEVFGATNDADYYSETCIFSNGILTLDLTNADLISDVRISFLAPDNLVGTQVSFAINNTVTSDGSISTIGPFLLYEALTDTEGNDVIQSPSVFKSGKYYVIRYSPTYQKFYYIGQQQAHAMVKLVDRMPSATEIAEQQDLENCDNLKFICLNDPTDSTKLYNSRFSIQQIGQRNKVLSGGEFENYATDASAMEVCEYEHWKSCRLTDTITVSTILIPWLDVNQKISYAPKYLNTKIPVEFLIKKINMTLGEGTMTLTLSRYFPYYPYIVENKY